MKDIKSDAEVLANYITLEGLTEQLEEAQLAKDSGNGYSTLDDVINCLKMAISLT